MTEPFENIYRNNWWSSKESISGTGSTLEITQTIRKYIPVIIKAYKINNFLDLPCGDFNWMKEIVDNIPNYIGADIVNDLILKNKEKYKYNFINLNILQDELPSNIDLIFCRDLFVHFSLKDIKFSLQKIKKSGIKYILMTTFFNRKFNDIGTGGWRPISFFDYPFNFPRPLQLINENCKEGYPKFKDKSLALWKLEDLNI